MQGLRQDPFHAQRGHAALAALVAVLLFGALAYVVSQDVSGSAPAVAATPAAPGLTLAGLVSYPNDVAAAVRKIAVEPAKLDFGPKVTGRNAVFGPQGIAYQTPTAVKGVQSEWIFKGITSDNHGYFVTGIGSDGPGGKDTIAALTVSKDLCGDLNEALSLPREPLAESPAVDLFGRGAGPKEKAGRNAFSFNAHAGDPKPAACVQNGDKYVYYRVIVAK